MSNRTNNLKVCFKIDDYNGNGYYDIKDFIEAPEKEILKFNDNMKFDVILANPPYDNGLCDKFNSKFFNLCNGEICWVSPSTWLTGKKQDTNITKNIDKYYTEILSINGNDYFDAGIMGLLSIVYVNMNKLHTIIYDNTQYNKCIDINKFSNDELLVEFHNNIKELYKNDSVQDHLKYIPGEGEKAHALAIKKHTEYNPNNNWYCLRITRFSINGNAIFSKNYVNLLQYKDYNSLKNTKDSLKYYIPFIKKIEAINAKHYLMGYFARTCLYLATTSNELCRGELKLVPWFDFSDPIFEGTPEEIDIALFEKYNVSQEIIDHILEILPNYYDLDLTKYKGQD